MSKDIGLVLALPPDLKAWVDEQASDIGLEAVTWLRMQIFAMRKRAQTPAEVTHGPWVEPELPSDTEPPFDPADLDAIVAARLAEAEEAGLTAVRPNPDAPPPLDATNVRPLRRPAPPFSTTPQHLRGLL